MRCEPVDDLACEHCGCTEDNACPGGCSWASLVPPICSRCAPASEPRGSFFGEEVCPASTTSALHAPIYLDDVSGYCARCWQGFVT